MKLQTLITYETHSDPITPIIKTKGEFFYNNKEYIRTAKIYLRTINNKHHVGLSIWNIHGSKIEHLSFDNEYTSFQTAKMIYSTTIDEWSNQDLLTPTLENMTKTNEETDVTCPRCKHPRSLLTKKTNNGNWHLCLKCVTSFFINTHQQEYKERFSLMIEIFEITLLWYKNPENTTDDLENDIEKAFYQEIKS